MSKETTAAAPPARSYRTEFALAVLLNTQALLRVLDRYLYANAAP